MTIATNGTDQSLLATEMFDQLCNLSDTCQAFYAGRRAAYKLTSVVLRTLLRGSSGDGPLATQVLPNATLQRPLITPDDTAPPDHLILPAPVTIGGNIHLAAGMGVKSAEIQGGAVANISVGEMFERRDANRIPLADWLACPFLRLEWTLEDFIVTVAHKDGGAHVDPNDDQLQAMQAWGYFHWHVTAGIGRSVMLQLHEQFMSAHPDFERKYP